MSAAAKSKAPPAEDIDQRDAFALVQAADQAVKAIESIRSRLGGKRDATAATGHLLDALVHTGGTIREYDRPKLWAFRHALGGESHTFSSPHAAAAVLLQLIVSGLRPPASLEEEQRHATANDEIVAIAKLLTLSEHSIEASRAVEQWDQGNARARDASHRAGHEARLAAAARVPGAIPSAARPRPALTETAPAAEPGLDGDYALPGTVDAPGGNPFPTKE
jgi:hypothetical protein